MNPAFTTYKIHHHWLRGWLQKHSSANAAAAAAAAAVSNYYFSAAAAAEVR